jgi:hypothetical protein
MIHKKLERRLKEKFPGKDIRIDDEKEMGHIEIIDGKKVRPKGYSLYINGVNKLFCYRLEDLERQARFELFKTE